MKHVMILLALFTMIGIVDAENLVSNGDFALGSNGTTDPDTQALDWTHWWNGGWINRETQANGITADNFHYALGNWEPPYDNGIYQYVEAAPGATYKLTFDAGSTDAWEVPHGTGVIEFDDDQDDSNGVLANSDLVQVDIPAQNVALPWKTYTVEGVAPAGTAFIRVVLMNQGDTAGTMRFDNVVLELLDSTASDPDPENGEIGVAVDYKTLSWGVHMVPDPADANEMILDPNMVSYDLIFGDDPNLANPANIIETASVVREGASPSWEVDPFRAEHTLTDNYDFDGVYHWRVDLVLDDATVVEGAVWTFEALKSIPVITAQPAPYTLVNPNDLVTLEVTATSVSTAVYQWYKVVDGASDAAVGVDSNQYVIASAQSTDDGSYYCEIRNNATEPTVPAQPATVSDVAVVGTKREIAHWSFETGSTDSSIGGTATTTTVVGSPSAAIGISGDGLAFADGETIFTDPNATYFDICNYNMTVGCWIQVDSNDVPDWSPLIARNGEEDGWQLRHGNTGAIGDKRARLTLQGVNAASGGTDGTASLDTPFDLEWHYVVGTYDGASRKVYVDGILQKVWWLTDGELNSAEGDDATGTIAPTASGVSIAGRYGQNPAQVDDQFIAGIYDEVEIWNYARTAAEIAQTYANVSGQSVCPSAPVFDFDGNCKENMVDFALFASGWLDDYTVTP